MNEERVHFKKQVEQAFEDVGATVICFENNPKRPAWDIELAKDGHVFPLRVLMIGWNIDELPVVIWRQPNPIWGWPHISCNGEICVSDREGLEYSPDDVGGVVQWLLSQATALLMQSMVMDDAARHDLFVDEIEGYLKSAGAEFVTLDEPIDIAKPIYAEVELLKKGKTGQYSPKVCRINQGSTKIPSCTQECLGLLDVRVDQITGITHKCGNDWWEEFLGRLTVDQLAIATSNKNRGIVLRVPNSFGYSLILIYWGSPSAKNRLTYLIQRQDRNYLIARTGGEVDPRHVIVVGCGAVGSRVAEHLALSGISKLTLVDHDKFSADNLGRHILGQQSISKWKVSELANLLKARMPGLVVDAMPTLAQNILDTQLLSNADAVVLATGNSVLERSIVRRAYRDKWPALLVSASVEAGGLGGHAIAMRSDTSGCLDCLYIDPDTQNSLLNMRTSLLAPEQKVTRQLTGCGSFTPYSALDAAKTAIRAVEGVLNNEPHYVRWVGDGKHAQKENIFPSEAYHALRQKRIASDMAPSQYAQPRCPCCGV